jgi:hypothetical protein
MKKLVLSLTLLSLWSCAKTNLQSGVNLPSSSPSNSGNGTTSTPGPATSTPPAVPVDPNAYKPVPLAWETSVAGSAAWSKAIYTYIKTSQPQMLGQNVADDVETFCPKYRSLSDNQRLNFWGQLFAGIAKYESGWKPTSRMVETTMDSIRSQDDKWPAKVYCNYLIRMKAAII